MRAFFATLTLTVLTLTLIAPSVEAQIKCSQVTRKSTSNALQLTTNLESLMASLPPQMQAAIAAYTQKILRVAPNHVLHNKTITSADIKDLSEAGTTPAEQKLFNWLAAQTNAGKLPQIVDQLLTWSLKKLESNPSMVSRVSALTPQHRALAQQLLTGAIQSTLSLRGLLNRPAQETADLYREWVDISADLSLFLKNIKKKPLEEILTDITAEKFFPAVEMGFLPDGIQAHNLRIQAMREARHELNFMFWAIYDDMTGAQIVSEAIKAQARGVKVRTIVDGQTSQRPGYGDQVAKLEASGVEVIRWFHPTLPHLGQHIKLMISDQRYVQGGGMNAGDVYSGINAEVPMWRDTDFFMESGAAVQASYNLFAKVWNEQVQMRGLPYGQMESLVLPQNFRTGQQENSGQVLVVRHNPEGYAQVSKISKSVLASIEHAIESVDIQNAYIITIPAVREVVKRAVARGVRVRISTNSSDSVDEAVIAAPILRSVQDLVKEGAQVYLRTGTTLHSKIVIVDQKISFIMSYNFHPRSERLENEMSFIVADQRMARSMTQQFESDIIKGKAVEVKRAEDIKISFDPLSPLGLRIFFDQL